MVSFSFTNPLGTGARELEANTAATNKDNNEDEASSEDGSIAATSLTEDDPLGGTDAMSQQAPPRYSSAAETVLWPGGIYIVFEKSSGRVITLSRGGVISLQDVDAADSDAQSRSGSADSHGVSNRWLCVERNGFFGLHDPRSGRYVGHDGNFGMVGSASEFRDWESVVARAHPEGGFQLLVPHWWHSLRTVVVAEDGRRLVTREHGETLWTFLKVA